MAGDFPKAVSLTLTNACNLRCRMCGQWSDEGYMRGEGGGPRPAMTPADWKRVVDELAEGGVGAVNLRGGEPFLFPPIIDLLDHIRARGLFSAMDTNGTMIGRFAEDIVRIGKIHLTVSVDGPEEIHDAVRGVPGCFRRIREGLAALRAAEAAAGTEISKSICFVISPYSVRGLGAMPDVARSLGIRTVAIVPYYFIPDGVGQAYERVLRGDLGCAAFSWRGFHHDASGVDMDVFREQHRRYRESLGDVQDYPYMTFTEEQYAAWFADAVTPVGKPGCSNVERLLDIQPDGRANFCVDFPDYAIGNVREQSIADMWNGERARRFREYRRAKPLPVCLRCGAKYMSEM